MAEKKILQHEGKSILPITHETAVIDDNGKTIPEKYVTKEEIPDMSSLAKEYEIGDLSNLATTNKINLVGAINELFRSGNNVKKQLVDALIAKGLDCSTDDSWEYLKDKISNEYRYSEGSGDSGSDSGGSGDSESNPNNLVLLKNGVLYNEDLTGGVTGYGMTYSPGQGIKVSIEGGSHRSAVSIFDNELDLTYYSSMNIRFYADKNLSQYEYMQLIAGEGYSYSYISNLPISTTATSYTFSLEGIGICNVMLNCNSEQTLNFYITDLEFSPDVFTSLPINIDEGDEINE